MTEDEINQIINIHFPGQGGSKPTSTISRTHTRKQLISVLGKLAEMKMETLLLYTAMPAAEPFHANNAHFRLLVGSNQCLAGTQRIYDPETRRTTAVQDIPGDFHVSSRNPATGGVEILSASKPFVKGYGDLYKFTLNTGETLQATMDHRVLSHDGQWVSMRDAWIGETDLLFGRNAASGRRRQLSGRAATCSLDDNDFLASHPQGFVTVNSDSACSVIRSEHLGKGPIWDISVPPHANYLCAGLVNANSAKTSAAAAEVARWCADGDPYDKYKKGPAKGLAIGLDEAHLADPMARKLFHPGAFKLVRDEHTRLYRFIRPDPNNPRELDPYDEAYREKWIDAPPLLPLRLIAHRPAMRHAAAGVPLLYEFVTGKKLEFRSSIAKPKQGDQNHLGWIDEAIENGGHFKQMTRSFMAVKGCGIWSATPENVSPYLWELQQRADKGDPSVFAVKLLLDDNFSIEKDEKEKFRASLRSEEEVRIHYYGEYAIVGRKIYPLYDPMVLHGCEPSDVPQESTLYVVVDPGRQHCATVIVAVDKEEAHRWVVDAFEIRNLTSANQWAAEIARRQRPYKFEAFVIDSQAGAAHSMAGGASIADQYWAALVQAGVRPRIQGPGKFGGFFGGLANVPAREEALCNWMDVRGDGPFAGTPMLKVIRGCCPELDRQIQFACTSSTTSDKRFMDKSMPQDLVTALEYAAAFNPCYHEIEAASEDPSETVFRNFTEFKNKTRGRQPVGFFR